MAELRLTGSPIIPEVASSIKLRQQVMNQESTNGTLDPAAKIKYVSSRMPWVRMYSSVNLSGAKAEYFKQLTAGEAAGSNLARRFVLKNYADDPYFQTEGLQGYSNSLKLGIRPEPGITSVNVKHFNRFGSLRATTINFVCWSLEQLEIMDVLYMRPGYTALLEFGHSVYVDPQGNIQNTKGGIDFFTVPQNTKAIYGAIEKQRKENNYHYDAVYGFIKNFKWTFRDDGGYDCTTEIVSIGEVIESIKASFASTGFSLEPQEKAVGPSFAGKNRLSNSEESSVEELSTIMHQILHTLKNDIQGLHRPDRRGFIQSTVSDSIRILLIRDFPGLSKVTNAGFTVAMYSPGTTTIDNGIANSLAQDQQPTYIKLALLLDILNLGIPADKDTKEKLYEFWTPSTVSQDLFHTYKYSQYRPSIDPGICLVHAHSDIFDFINIAEGERKAGDYTSQNRIDEIFVNIDFILNQYTPDLDLLQFVKNILAGIRAALGGINDFEVQYFEEAGLYAIVDRNRIHESTYESRPKLEIFGNKTFTKGVTLSSLLSPKISTMIAIGAQAGGSSGGIEGTAFAKLNAGLTDRIKPVKLAGADATTSAATPAKEEGVTLTPLDILEGHLFNLYREYEYIPQDCQNIIQIYSDYLADKVAETQNPSFAFVIPFELSLTVDGISGLKITEAFDISDEILPAPYKNQTGRSIVSFLITGLDQNITSAGWVTGIRSQMYISETSQGKYGYNVDNITLSPRETLFSTGGPTTDGASILYYNGVVTTPSAFTATQLHTSPSVREPFRLFLQSVLDATPGIRVDIVSTIRTEAKQKELYDRYIAGLSDLPAAPPGASAHELGMAIDFNISDVVTKARLASGPAAKEVWQKYKIGELAAQAGLRWGGNWTDKQYDPVHVDITTESAFNVSKTVFLEKFTARVNKSLEKWQYDPRQEPVAPNITGQSAPPVAGPRVDVPAPASTGATPPPLRIDPSAAAAVTTGLRNLGG